MIDLLIDLEIPTKDIEIILKENEELVNYDICEALKNINILKSINCNNNIIRNIIYTNSYFLNRNSDDIILLIERLKQLEFNNLSDLFDSNPYFLDKYSYEIDDFVRKKINNDNLSKEEVIDLIEDNSYIIDEE